MNPDTPSVSARQPIGVPDGARVPGDSPRWARLAPLGFVAAVAVAVTVRDPHVVGSWAVCPTYGLFGVFCPGCGSLRGLNDLVQGDLVAAVGHNALLIPAILFAVWAAVGRPGPRWGRVWLVAVIAFTVLRNVPGSPLGA